MPTKLRSRLNYSNVMATVAVFLALGGTSYAVATGSIGSREIGNNSIRSKDLRNNDVRGKDVRNGAIGTRDVADGALLAADFQAGQLPAGERGLQGEPGPPGQDATKLFAYIRDNGSNLPASVHYGNGVTGVIDPDGDNAYRVAFDRALTNCVAQVVAGIGEPEGTFAAVNSSALVSLGQPTPSEVRITFVMSGGTVTDTAFMISAFC